MQLTPFHPLLRHDGYLTKMSDPATVSGPGPTVRRLAVSPVRLHAPLSKLLGGDAVRWLRVGITGVIMVLSLLTKYPGPPSKRSFLELVVSIGL